MSAKPELTTYIRAAQAQGARAARIIAVKTIVTAAWVRQKCQFGCGGYGERLTCPPHSPTPEQTAAVLKDYRRALLIQGDDHTDVTTIAVALERQAFLDGYYKAFAYGSGPCRLCGACNIKARSCRHPEEARPALEACGIDVFQTVRNNGYPIAVVKNRQDQQNYYGLVLIE